MTFQRASLRSALAALAPAIALCACDRAPEGHDDHAHAEDHAPAPTNRVDIPDAVRRNLGITFARVEPRNVERVLRVPGRFELLPTARREYRAPLDGTVELLVQPQQSVDAGTPLYRLRSAEWQRLVQDAAAARARVESMVPMKAALDAQELSQRERLKVWQDRLAQLERIREAGGGSAAQFAEARTQFSAAQSELAAVSVRMAEIESAHRVAEADLAARDAQVRMIRDAAGCGDAAEDSSDLVVCASMAGRVELIAVTQGGRVDASAVVATAVNPDGVWFRARALQSDLGRLADGMRAVVAPPSGGSLESQSAIAGALKVGATADADGRTIDLYLMPEGGALWARSGVAASLEVTLEDAPEELAIPLSAVVRDGAKPVIFRRDPANPDRAIRLDADLGPSDGRWIAVLSGVREGDEVVVAGAYQLMLSMSGSSPKGGHFHADGTFHAEDH